METEPQKRARQKWEENNREQKRIQVKKSNAKNFIRNHASSLDMWEFISIYNRANPDNAILVEKHTQTPEQVTNPLNKVTEYVKSFRKETAQILLNDILNMDAVAFEDLVVKLLVSMGYSDRGGEAFVTKQSGDAGVDGIINRDPLGTSTVYIQAKRYNLTRKVSRPEIQAFSGALKEKNTDRGVFITTSSFTKEAQDSIKSLNIIPIDGERLTELMLDYKVGVKVRNAYEVLEVDEDFFA